MTKYIITAIAFLSLIGIISLQNSRLKKAKADRDVYKANTANLLEDIGRYQTKDSLNVVSVGQLQLTLDEYKKHRDEDMKLIETMNIDKKRLLNTVSLETKTIHTLEGTVRDSIVYVNNYITETMRCLTIHDKWYDIDGCTDKDNIFRGTFRYRDSLKCIAHVVPRKFLFFKWGEKERRTEVVSKNPNTVITGVEFITLRN